MDCSGSWKRFAFALGLGAALAAPSRGTSPAAAEVVAGPVGQRVDDYLTSVSRFGFSGQVLVAQNDVVVLHRAYGWADPATRTTLTIHTPMGVASMSKRFAAAAVLRLVADGRLSLTSTLGDLLPGVPADKATITVQQILTHSSGLRGGYSDDFAHHGRDVSVESLLAQPLMSTPGAQWHYSSEAYNLIAAIVDRVAGDRVAGDRVAGDRSQNGSYEAYTARALFAPLGLDATGFQSAPASSTAPPAPARVGLRSSGRPDQWPRNWRIRGGGDVMSTVADLYRAHQQLSAGTVMPKALADTMLTPQFTVTDGVDAGLGVMLSRDDDGTFVEWAGDTDIGYNGVLFDYPDRHLVVVILTPGRDAFGRSLRQLVQAEVIALAFGRDVPPYPPARASSPEELTRAAGSYPLLDGSIDLISDGAQLWLAPSGVQATRRILAALDLAAPESDAVARTNDLLGRLRDGDIASFADALGAKGAGALAEYQREWTELIAQDGPLRAFAIVGETARRGGVEALVRLDLRDRTRPMSLWWSDSGRGRLAGTDPRASAFPTLLAVAVTPTGHLVACDSWRVTCTELTRETDDRLTIRGQSHTTTQALTRTTWLPHH